MATLARTQFPARLIYEDSRPEIPFVYFVARDEDDKGYYRDIKTDHATWVELGRPTVITVTIEPGDRLNEEAL